jgi:hypothetical protein
VIDAIRPDPEQWQIDDFRLRANLGPQHVERDQPPLVDGREFVELFDPGLAWDFHGSHGALAFQSFSY